ncbi:MAG: 50S ribosome-binding GTPase [Phycisphaerae bacterium]|nr:50S ribosome-binding GTPase [Phycisphaerae bacterium]
MAAFAAVMTGQGLGAIATVQLFGDSAEDVLRRVFRTKGGKPFEPADGRIVLGGIVAGGEMIDEVTIGCEDPHAFAIHCHGNPLIVERIMEVLQRQGAQAVAAEQLFVRALTSKKNLDSIRIEAKLALATVKTIEGAAILANQVKAGLSERIRQWQNRLDSMPLEEVVAEVGDILERSEPARLIISGCIIALVGPPNTGKSTLLNTLAGREKAIVSDIRGTTRDWVSAEIHIPPLAATVIDTAGLDSSIAASGGVEQAAQQKTAVMIERADLVLLVVDFSQPVEQLSEPVLKLLAGRRVVTVLNKADLPSRFDPASVPGQWGPAIQISAKQGCGIDDLICAIHRVCHVADFNLHTPVAFTDRQTHLLKALRHSGSNFKARSILSDLIESLLLNTGGKYPTEVS